MEKIKQFVDSPLVKRIKSYLWRAAMMALAAGIAFAINNLGDLTLPTYVVVPFGLLLGEISKALNTYLTSLSEQNKQN